MAISYTQDVYQSEYRTSYDTVITPPDPTPVRTPVYKYQLTCTLARISTTQYRVIYGIMYMCYENGTLNLNLNGAESSIAVSDSSTHMSSSYRIDTITTDTQEHEFAFSCSVGFTDEDGEKHTSLKDVFTLHLEPAKWSVTFNVNGGNTPVGPENGYAGETMQIPSTTPGHADSSETYGITITAAVSGATVSYGSSGQQSSFSIAKAWTRAYRFVGWNTKQDGSGDSYKSGQEFVIPEGGTTLYAQWTSEPKGRTNLLWWDAFSGQLSGYKLVGFTESQDDEEFVLSPDKKIYEPHGGCTLYAVWVPENMSNAWISFYCDGGLEDVGDGTTLYLEGFKDRENDGLYKVKAYTYDSTSKYVTLKFYEDFAKEGRQSASTQNLQIYLAGNVVPQFDYICSLDNRLWGCSSARRTIYASALGDPTDFFRFQGDSLDSYQVAVATAGEFTGAVAMNHNVLFLKQHCLHKVLGSFPAEYQVYTYDMDGTSETNGLSAINCNGVVIYVSEHGISTYEGSSAGVLSKELGEGNMSHSRAMFNGEEYFLTYKDSNGDAKLYVFDTRYGIWTQRDASDGVQALAHLKDRDYLLTEDGTIYRLDSGRPLEGDWSMLFKPFYESLSGSWGSKSHIFEKKRYTGLTFRVELPLGSWIKAEIMTDNGRWRPVVRMAGRKDKVTDFTVKPNRCDKMQLRLSGHGPMTILGMERQYTIGSRR